MSTQLPPTASIRWSAGTWLLLLAFLLSGSLISYWLRNFTDSLLLYLPTSLGIVLIHWFGLRVLPLAFINSIFSLWLWDAPGGIGRILLIGTREPVVALASWLLCRNLVRSSNGLSDTYSFIRFTILGIIVPDFINSIYTYHYTFIGKDLERVVLLWLSDFITIFSISIPLLHFFRPVSFRNFFKLTQYPEALQHKSKVGGWELIILTSLFLILSLQVHFDKYWFIYGFVAALVAVRNGFQTAILANIIIYVLNYIIPLIDFGKLITVSIASTQEVNVHLGMGTMFFTTALIGRAITDLLRTESVLMTQSKQTEEANDKLRTANREMDRFVYSVSHDISAPLKSIKGLINLSKLEESPAVQTAYLAKMEKSILKLEDFVAEVLDHSRTNRKEVLFEPVDLPRLINEINENLVYLDNFSKIKFDIQLNPPEIVTDKLLVKVVLNNLISNAAKYQKPYEDHTPEISIHSKIEGNEVEILISDNGEGIQDTYQERIFEMFYRGTSRSTGSGLGLYIAKEAIEKLNGKILVRSVYGKGSVFTITLPIQTASEAPAGLSA